MSENRRNLIRMDGICKRYFEGKENELQVLTDVRFDIHEGEFVSIVGESGSGKSTIMNILGILDRPSEGSYFLQGIDVRDLPDSERSRIRNREIGFVFQTFNLLGRSSALHNVELPMLYAGVPRAKRKQRAAELLELVGMTERKGHRPNELSGGQKQRVAIARAMANDPAIILADEPTGALDTKTGRMVMDIFHDLHRKHGKTVILITHNRSLAEETSRVIALSDGRIVSDSAAAGYDAAPRGEADAWGAQTGGDES